MPWIYNPTPQVQRAKAFDGSLLSFPPREKVYVKPERMSAYVWNLIRERKLASRGGDPKPTPVPKAVTNPAPAAKAVAKSVSKPKPVSVPKVVNRPEDLVTSSSHHQTHGKVTSESSVSGSVEKKPKAEKKQTDDSKKVDTQGNSKTKIEANAAEKPKKRRKRTFDRKG